MLAGTDYSSIENFFASKNWSFAKYSNITLFPYLALRPKNLIDFVKFRGKDKSYLQGTEY